MCEGAPTEGAGNTSSSDIQQEITWVASTSYSPPNTPPLASPLKDMDVSYSSIMSATPSNSISLSDSINLEIAVEHMHSQIEILTAQLQQTKDHNRMLESRICQLEKVMLSNPLSPFLWTDQPDLPSSMHIEQPLPTCDTAGMLLQPSTTLAVHAGHGQPGSMQSQPTLSATTTNNATGLLSTDKVLQKYTALIKQKEENINRAIAEYLVRHLCCWNHLQTRAQQWLRKHGTTTSECSVYMQHIKQLLMILEEEKCTGNATKCYVPSRASLLLSIMYSKFILQ